MLDGDIVLSLTKGDDMLHVVGQPMTNGGRRSCWVSACLRVKLQREDTNTLFLVRCGKQRTEIHIESTKFQL